MEIQIQKFTVHKRFPLTISRGTTAQTTNVWVKVIADGIEGWGEASPFSAGRQPQTTEAIAAALAAITPVLTRYHPLERQAIEQAMLTAQLPSAAQAALDTALHDWLGKSVGLPLWQVWGLERDRIVPTSVTVGINTPEAAAQRVRDWLELAPFQAVKIKLGNPAGIEADQAMFAAVQAEISADLQLSVDANGGWNLQDAVKMCHWLADQGVKYVEQPLAPGQEAKLPALYQESPLPILVDESCFTSQDIPALAPCVHGINIKLMKCGGLTEAMRMIQTARACNLQVMFGCYSDSGLANTAMSHLAACADYLDLDSHFNLTDDPFEGAQLQGGRLLPNDHPGLGITWKSGS